MNFHRLPSFAGLAAVIVPCAIIVHLVAEAVATGGDGVQVDFIVRHGYFAALFLAAALWFGSTVGLGRPARERRRRCALLRADLHGARRPQSLMLLFGTNLAFFTLTQAFEGIPIASGAVGLGVGVALAGSLLSALMVFVFGQSLVAAGLDSVIGTSSLRHSAATLSQRDCMIVAPRHATAAYSLFVPNRPPPAASHI